MGNSATRPQSSMSNGQMQTRGLSAADWTRLKRLRGARSNGYSYSEGGVYVDGVLTTNKDINPPGVPQIPYGKPIKVFKTVGTSKIRRPASDWIAYKASQTADYPTPSGQLVPGYESGTIQVMTKLCSCNNTLLETKVAGCSRCRHDPIENYPKCPPDSTIYDIDFNNALSGDYGSLFVPFTIPNGCTSTTLNFRYINLPGGSDWVPEIDATTDLNGSGLTIEFTPYTVAYDGPYYSSFCVYTEDVFITNNNILTLTVPNGISGTIYVGGYPY